MKKTRRFIFLVLALLISAVSSVSAASDTSAVDAARNGVIRVVCDYSPDGNTISHGTGFIVALGDDSTLIVTNRHVVEQGPDSIYIVLDYWDWRMGGGTKVKAEVIAPWDDLDLVFLATETPLEGREALPLMESDDVNIAQEVYALGFPGVADDITDDGNSLPSTIDDISVTRGVVSKLNATIDGAAAYQMDATINHGNSGGPLITEDGFVIGINTWGSEPGTNFAIHADYVIQALDEAGIGFDPESPDSPNSPDSPGVNEAPDAPASPAVAIPPPPVISGGDSVLDNINSGVIGIIAVVVIGVFGVLFSNKTRKKNSPSPASGTGGGVKQPEPIKFTSAPVSLILVCTRGSLEGGSFPINGRLVMGRDAGRCNIVFPPNTPGVSSMHCELRSDMGGVLLVDLGSTYGTFLPGGKKLEANKPVSLRSGDAFYLSSGEERFVIR